MSSSADATCPCYDSPGDKHVGAHMCVSARVCLNVFLGEDDFKTSLVALTNCKLTKVCHEEKH